MVGLGRRGPQELKVVGERTQELKQGGKGPGGHPHLLLPALPLLEASSDIAKPSPRASESGEGTAPLPPHDVGPRIPGQPTGLRIGVTMNK